MVEREHLTQMIKQQTELLSQLHEENKKLKLDVTELAGELDNTLNALILKESYQDEYLDENLSRLELLVVRCSVHNAKQLLGKQE